MKSTLDKCTHRCDTATWKSGQNARLENDLESVSVPSMTCRQTALCPPPHQVAKMAPTHQC
eukprot:838500-Amphidinium_carterae.2